MNEQESKNIKILRSESIFKYFMELSDELETMILCKPADTKLVVSDQSLYEALGSLPDPSTMNHNKLIKFLEVVDIYPHARNGARRSVLTHEKVDEIRRSIKEITNKKES